LEKSELQRQSSLSNSFERKTGNKDPQGKLKKVVKSKAGSNAKSVGHKSPLEVTGYFDSL
jgi:hypothetical protein